MQRKSKRSHDDPNEALPGAHLASRNGHRAHAPAAERRGRGRRFTMHRGRCSAPLSSSAGTRPRTRARLARSAANAAKAAAYRRPRATSHAGTPAGRSEPCSARADCCGPATDCTRTVETAACSRALISSGNATRCVGSRRRSARSRSSRALAAPAARTVLARGAPLPGAMVLVAFVLRLVQFVDRLVRRRVQRILEADPRASWTDCELLDEQKVANDGAALMRSGTYFESGLSMVSSPSCPA